MAEHSPPDTRTTTVRLPGDLRQRVQEAADDDRRSFNGQVIILLGEALDARRRTKAAR